MSPPVGPAVNDVNDPCIVGDGQPLHQLDGGVQQGVGVHMSGQQVPGLGESFDRDGPFPVLRSVSQALRDGGEHVQILAAEGLAATAVQQQQLVDLAGAGRHRDEGGRPEA
jgi:hypothetical protein